MGDKGSREGGRPAATLLDDGGSSLEDNDVGISITPIIGLTTLLFAVVIGKDINDSRCSWFRAA